MIKRLGRGFLLYTSLATNFLPTPNLANPAVPPDHNSAIISQYAARFRDCSHASFGNGRSRLNRLLLRGLRVASVAMSESIQPRAPIFSAILTALIAFAGCEK